MSTANLIRCSPVARNCNFSSDHSPINPRTVNFSCSALFSAPSLSFNSRQTQARLISESFALSSTGGDGNYGAGHGGKGGEGGGKGDSSGWSDGGKDQSVNDLWGILGLFLNGWRSRVAADPQFPFKVLMEELVGVSSCVLGDMASRPNFGLNELDFVFSTLVVGCIVNFTLMYLLAPTAGASASKLPAIFANCPKSHMFEPGAFGIMHRLGTFVYKGTLFAAVGFAAGLVGTALSNALIKLRKKMDPTFETPNKAPPTLLNAATWAIHMGISSNFRYQTLNGIEFVLEKGVSPFFFKASVIIMRCLNNIMGGMSFVVLARLTGSQSTDGSQKTLVAESQSSVEEVSLDNVDLSSSGPADSK
uniref:Uncharacterized protein n=1 Tax=Kalanchoe fedtschenkoi TaxID=63787 RepID=A0A7N0T2Z7_KALFE